MDTLYISDLAVETIIGVHSWEQQVKRRLILDLEMAVDIAKAAKTDDIEDAVNYHTVCQHVEAFAKSKQFKLIEAFADQLAVSLMSAFGIASLQLRVNKPGAVKHAKTVGIVVKR